MTVSEISRLLIKGYNEKGGKDYFTASGFISAVFEKNGLRKDERFIHPEKELSAEMADTILSDAERILSGYPLQYYIGTEFFCGYEFLVRENVLIPRADSETLVCAALEKMRDSGAFLDLCCGSGCIGISILKKNKNMNCIFADISKDALSLARDNAEHLSVSSRSNIRECDLFSDDIFPLIKENDISFLVSNPPYIRSDVIPRLAENVKNEPALALDGGEDGLLFYRRILDIVSICKIPFALEIGFDQREALLAECEKRNIKASCKKDASGNDRVILSE